MKKVLIVSTSTAEQRSMEEVAKYHDPNSIKIETTASFGQDSAWWRESAPDLLVVRLPEEELLQEYFFAKLKKDVPRGQPILFLTQNISSSLMQLSTVFGKIRMVKLPADPFILFRAVLDAVKEYEPGRQQVHPRFMTDHAVTVESQGASNQMKATMKNLSLSGAFFEAKASSPKLQPGELIKMFIQVGVPQKQYEFKAKVVWSKPMKDPGVQGYGVTFVDRDEIYENLLKNI